MGPHPVENRDKSFSKPQMLMPDSNVTNYC